MKTKDIKLFFNNIRKINLSNEEKKRMLRLFQVRGINKKNKVMSYSIFTEFMKKNNGNITNIIIGPKWNRLVFVDIDIEV